jgi:hypothetical protein
MVKYSLMNCTSIAYTVPCYKLFFELTSDFIGSFCGNRAKKSRHLLQDGGSLAPPQIGAW